MIYFYEIFVIKNQKIINKIIKIYNLKYINDNFLRCPMEKKNNI